VSNVGALAPAIAEHYDAPLSVIGLLTSVVFLAELFVLLPGGAAVDRYGPKRIAVVGLWLITLAGVGLLASGGVGGALILRFLIGIGVGLSFLAGSDYVRRGSRSAFAQGIYGAAGLAASGIMLALLPPLGAAIGWWVAFAVPAAVTGLCAIAISLAPAQAAREPAPGRARRRDVLDLLATRRIVWLGLVQAASFGTSLVLATWAVSLLVAAGHSLAFAGAASALTLVTGVLARPVGGWLALSGPVAVRGTLVGALVTGAIGSALVAAAPANPVAAIWGTSLVGVAGGLPFGLVLSNAAMLCPERPGLAVAVTNAYPIAVIVLGVPLVGLSFQIPGHGRIGFAAAAAAFLAALPFAVRVARSGSMQVRQTA
jgi:nitrate/nitrite transporter NarK